MSLIHKPETEEVLKIDPEVILLGRGFSGARVVITSHRTGRVDLLVHNKTNTTFYLGKADAIAMFSDPVLKTLGLLP